MLRQHPEGVIVEVWVVPGSSRDRVGGSYDGALRVRTSAPPAAGAANRSVARLVADAFAGRRGRVISGRGARRKQILVEGIDEATAAPVLQMLLGGQP